MSIAQLAAISLGTAKLYPLGVQYKDDNGDFNRTAFMLVNPTDITVTKRPSISETRTMGGTIFQPWVNLPDQITFKGIMYGTRSVLDLFTLASTVGGKPHMREIKLLYKYTLYPGYVTAMTMSAKADAPRVFDYSFTFLSERSFVLTRMMLGQTTDLVVEQNWFNSQLKGMKVELAGNTRGKADPFRVMSFGAAAIGMGYSIYKTPATVVSLPVQIGKLLTSAGDPDAPSNSFFTR